MSEAASGLEIALVGMACRYPGADDPEAFWANLAAGVDSISFFTPAELAAAGVGQEMIQHPDYVPAKGVLADIEGFSADFFGYSPEQAAMMDPQARLLHECAWEALADAGCDPRRQSEPIGAYIGGETNPFWLGRAGAGLGPGGQFQASLYGESKYFAALIAHRLDLRGPALTLQTACSSSLVAAHLACQGLLAGECRLALAGGVSIFVPHRVGYLYQEGMMLSRDGRCRPFADQANGAVFSDGLGLVALKRLDDALADGDAVYAVIRGSAINNDGAARAGFAAPGTRGQAEVIRTAFEAAAVDPETVGLVEAHGTGTRVGDAVEVEALTRAFSTSRRGFCRLGSVKGNLGHLFYAAGVAGLMKAALALDRRLAPPSLHCARPNPMLELERTPFTVNSTPWPWENPPGAPPRRAGVSSFGIGGTNAHLVLEEAPLAARRSGRPRPRPPVFQRQRFPLPMTAPDQPPPPSRTADSEPSDTDKARQVLAALWREALGNRIGGPEDDFFSLGGDSLALLALVERIAQRLGARLAIQAVLQRPTLAGLTDLIATAASAPAGPAETRKTAAAPVSELPLMELRREGAETLFCFPDIMGRGLVFLPLASLIPGLRVLALNYPVGPDLIEHCLAAVLASQDRQPATFLGYSAGASVALAVARELERRGRPVRRLVFLDAYRPSPRLLASPERQRELKEWLFAALAEQQVDPEEVDQQRARFDHCLTLATGAPVTADIHLITAADRQLSELFTDWSGATTGDHLTHAGSGSHLEMLRFPFVKDNHRILADIMDSDLSGGKTCP